MNQLIVYLVFMFSVAFAAVGVILATKLRTKYSSEIFSSLVYYQVFIFTFGFYGLWGQVVIKAFLSEYVSTDLLTRFSGIAILLGLPFLVFSWMMLIKFSRELAGNKTNNSLVFLFLTLNFIIIFGIGYLITTYLNQKPLTLVKYYYAAFSFLYSTIAAIIIVLNLKKSRNLNINDRRIIGLAIVLIMAIHCIVLIFFEGQAWLALLFIFIFFSGNSFLPLYLSYGTKFAAFSEEQIKDLSFDEFCNHYEVSPRETDIIREICNGLSNMEISNKLFISIQTVKDHTHRIYIKTNVKSRAQLMNLVKDIRGIK